MQLSGVRPSVCYESHVLHYLLPAKRDSLFTARCYASAVLAIALCLSVCLSARPSVRHKSEFY